MSWNSSRFSNWEVEGEVRQRVGRALAEAEEGRLSTRCQGSREPSAIVRAMDSLQERLIALSISVRGSQGTIGARMRAPLVFEKGDEKGQEAG